MKQEVYQTKHILEKFNLSRQTLYNWIKDDQISEPELDWRGWRVWRKEHLNEIENHIQTKKEKNQLLREQANAEQETLYIYNRRYLGSKAKLVPFISSIIEEHCGSINSISDIFAGTAVIANKFNSSKVKVIVNDILYSNYVTYLTWFSNEPYNIKKINKIIKDLNNINPIEDNYVSLNFGDKFFSYDNALKIGAVREAIECLADSLTIREKAILLTSLIYAMDKVANTCGHYDAFRRRMDTLQPLKLKMPEIKDEANVSNEIFNTDANKLVRQIKSDVVYIDTPYNSRQYIDAYHLLENVAKWEKPDVIGVARKMVNRSEQKSLYCTSKAPIVFKDLIENINAKFIVVSYNNMAQKGSGRSNAKISDEEILDVLKLRGKVKTFDKEFKYFTTGKRSITDHRERVFLCECY